MGYTKFQIKKPW